MLVSATAKERLTGDVQNVSRNPLQRRGAAAKRRCALQPAGGFIGRVQGAQVTARQSGCIREDAASQVVASWMETRCPSGPGRDSIAGSVRSMTARPDARSLSSQKGKSDTQRKVNEIKRGSKKLWTGLYRETGNTQRKKCRPMEFHSGNTGAEGAGTTTGRQNACQGFCGAGNGQGVPPLPCTLHQLLRWNTGATLNEKAAAKVNRVLHGHKLAD